MNALGASSVKAFTANVNFSVFYSFDS